MNFRICISLFLLCCLLQPSTAQKPVTKPKEVTIKAMTYNTYSGRKQGIDKIAEVIKKENPDIVSLQEIERNTEINPWDTPKNTLEWLSKTSFSKEELSRICHINAEKLLGLN